MKKSIYSFIILCLLIPLFSCTTTKNNSETKNAAFIAENNIENKITVTGILKQGSSGFYISQNPESKSAVTILLTGTESSKKILNKLIDKEVTITGKLISAPSPWKKEVEFLSVK